MKKKFAIAFLPWLLFHSITWLPIETLLPSAFWESIGAKMGVTEIWEVVMIVKMTAYAATWFYGVIYFSIGLTAILLTIRKKNKRRMEKDILKHSQAEKDWLRTGKF